MRTIRSRLIAIGILLAIAVWQLIPTNVTQRVRDATTGRMKDTTIRRVPINLGLDLQGGIDGDAPDRGVLHAPEIDGDAPDRGVLHAPGRRVPINLGLDLQGGIHLALEVDQMNPALQIEPEI